MWCREARVLSLLVALCASATAQTINAYAGDGVAAYAGDGGQAAASSLKQPFQVATDSAGSLYIADSGNLRIRKVNVGSGLIVTVAGGGTGNPNASLPATAVGLGNPIGVAVDSAGNIYIADANFSKIWKVSAATGLISTFAGSGGTGTGGDGGPATAAQFISPAAVALDGNGNVFIADQLANRVRRVDASTGIITTFAGTGVNTFNGDNIPATSANLTTPDALAIDSAGNVFIGEYGAFRVRRVDAATGIITTVAGSGTFGFAGDGGPATSANLGGVAALALDSSGTLFIADYTNSRVRRVSGGTITTIAGTGSSLFSGDGGPATSAGIASVTGLAVDGAGELFVSAYNTNRVRVVTGLNIIAPVPTITGLSPAGTAAGSSLFVLTVSGTGFGPASTVLWNGVSRSTAYVNSATLRAVIAASDVASVGSAAVSVFTPGPGGGTSSGAPFTIATLATDTPGSAPVIINTPSSKTVNTSTSVIAANATTPTCGSHSKQKSAWFSFTAPIGGAVTADLAGSTYQTLLSGWQGASPASLVAIANGCAEATLAPSRAGGGGTIIQPKVTFQMNAGQTIWLLITATNGDGGTLNLGLSFAAGLAVPQAAYSTMMPHVVTGGGYVTKLTIVNMAGATNSVSVNFVDNTGVVTSSTTRTLAIGEAMRVATAESARNGPIATQWASLSAQGRIAANLFYEISDQTPQNNIINSVGFNDDAGGTTFVLPVEFEPLSGGNITHTVGLALSNPTAVQNTVTLTLRDTTGATVGTSNVVMPPYSHTQRSLDFDFANVLPAGNFVGSVRGLSTPQGVSAIALGDDHGPFFSTPPLAGATRLVVPHMVSGVASGTGYVTKLTLVNLAAVSNTVNIVYYDQTGLITNPQSLMTSVVIPANGSARIATPESARFQSLYVQWALITSSANLGINLFFEVQDGTSAHNVINTIGFNNAAELTDFTVPVELEPASQVSTVGRTVGIAMANAGSTSATVTLTLLRADGTTLGSLVKNIAAKAQLISSIQTEFATQLPAGNFIGSLVVHSSAAISAVALEDDYGPFSSVPVVVGRP